MTFSTRKSRDLRPVTFVPIEQAFKPQVKVQAVRDLSGWVGGDKRNRVKWEIGKGRIGCIDADKAREFAAKGFVRILEGKVEPVSEDELAELLSQVTIIGPGASNG